MKSILRRSVLAIIVILGIYFYMQVVLLFDDKALPVRDEVYMKIFNNDNARKTSTQRSPVMSTMSNTSNSSSRTGDNQANFKDVPLRLQYVESFWKNFEHSLKTGRKPPQWQKELYNRTKHSVPVKTSFFLTHLLMIRIYQADKARWTYRELKQWMHYMLLIGIEHFYLCEHYHDGDENMMKNLERYISLGLLTYSRVHTKKAMTAQIECYRKWVNLVGKKSAWMTSVDMDEYPFHLKDKQENFLQRYLAKMDTTHPEVGEVSMQNYLMLGQGNRTRNMTIDRIRRSTPSKANALVKPLFRPEFVRPDIHHGSVMYPKVSIDADVNELRMLHYWGARMQDWGPDTPKVLNMTVPYNDIAEAWADRIRNSLSTFGEDDAFSSKTGP